MAEMEVEEKVEEEERLVTEIRKIVENNSKSLVSEIATRLMSDVEERLEITEEWAQKLTEMLDLERPNEAPLPRVATALMNVNPEAYIPRFISMGPYHHWKLKKDIASSARGTYQGRSLKISTAEEYKVKSAARVSQTLRQNNKSFKSIVEAIEGMRLDIEQFYDWKIEDGPNCCKNFSLMMAVDSSFLLCFLFGLFRDHRQQHPAGVRHEYQAKLATAEPVGAPPPSHEDMVNLSALQDCIKCDILKLENQIPLFVVKHVFEYGKDVLAEAHEQDFAYMLKKTYTVLSPFDATEVAKFEPKFVIDDEIEKKSHLLDCMQAIISPFLQMRVEAEKEGWTDEPVFKRIKHFLSEIVTTVCGCIFITHPIKKLHHDFLIAYNAEQLDKAGIKFKSFTDPKDQIRFDKYSDTLYLPRITVSHVHTEVFLRNMLALEFNDPARPNPVTRYVGLMDCLIDTPKDVRLLRDSDVIRRRSLMLTDENVAKMWDGMCQPFFTGHLGLPEELKGALHEEVISKYYKSRIKSMFREFHGEFLSRPWKIVALLVGCCVLAITVIQGLCSFYDCSRKSDSDKNSTQKWGHGV